MWKILLGCFGFITLLVLIVAFSNIDSVTYFRFLFSTSSRSIFGVIMWMYLLGVIAGVLIGLIPLVLSKDSGSAGIPDDIDL